MCICIPKYSDETYSQRLWGTREKKENKYLKRVAIVLVPELDGYLLFVVLRRGCPNIRSIFIARNICLMGRRWVFTDGDKKKKEGNGQIDRNEGQRVVSLLFTFDKIADSIVSCL